MAKIFFSDIQSVNLNYHTPSLKISKLNRQIRDFRGDSLDKLYANACFDDKQLDRCNGIKAIP